MPPEEANPTVASTVAAMPDTDTSRRKSRLSIDTSSASPTIKRVNGTNRRNSMLPSQKFLIAKPEPLPEENVHNELKEKEQIKEDNEQVKEDKEQVKDEKKQPKVAKRRMTITAIERVPKTECVSILSKAPKNATHKSGLKQQLQQEKLKFDANLYDNEENSVDSYCMTTNASNKPSTVNNGVNNANLYGLVPQMPPGCTQVDLDLFKRVKEMSAKALKTDDVKCKSLTNKLGYLKRLFLIFLCVSW